jgi:hypothetical protein
LVVKRIGRRDAALLAEVCVDDQRQIIRVAARADRVDAKARVGGAPALQARFQFVRL